MSGCDYCPTIPRIASITSYKLIKEHKNIERCMQHIKKKYKIPDNFNYERAREIFRLPSILNTEISREKLILK
jgi:flap endonuclease-1